jgi:hypothetical protein
MFGIVAAQTMWVGRKWGTEKVKATVTGSETKMSHHLHYKIFAFPPKGLSLPCRNTGTTESLHRWHLYDPLLCYKKIMWQSKPAGKGESLGEEVTKVMA